MEFITAQPVDSTCEEEQLMLSIKQCENVTPSNSVYWQVKHTLLQKIHVALNTGHLFSMGALHQIISTVQDCLLSPNFSTTILAADCLCKTFEYSSDTLSENSLLEISGKIFQALDVPSNEQRKVIGCLLHALYFRHVAFRGYLRILMGETITQTSTRGISEILDVLTLVIQGFSLPVKEEHTAFCRMYLIPLIQHEDLSSFYPSLRRCLIDFVRRAPQVAREIVSHSLLQVSVNSTNDPKMFFDLAVDVLPLLSDSEFFSLQVLLYDRMARLMKNSHTTSTAVRAFEDGAVCALILKNIEISRRFLLPALQTSILVQIDPSVATRCFNALKLIQSA